MVRLSLENSLAVPQMFNVHFIYDLAVLLLDVYSREIKAYVHTKHVHMFIAASFRIAPKWKKPKCPLAEDGIWYSYTRVFLTHRKRDIMSSAVI